MLPTYDLVGLGIGPFNLSLAALSSGIPGLKSAFFEQHSSFRWHRELMLPDAEMQTCFLKDLVTPADPTSPHSFLSYLVAKGLFYAFLNSDRRMVSRLEFEDYCRWVSQRLGNLHFQHKIRELQFNGQHFVLRFDQGEVLAESVCLGTGLVPYIPTWAEALLGERCFHPKSQGLDGLKVDGQRVLIVGGGQTGAEIFLNLLRGRWGKPREITWLSRRMNLQALDDSAFTNEYFSPAYVREFFQLAPQKKDKIVAQQKLASDGITPSYLTEIYRELYQQRVVGGDSVASAEVLPGRDCHGLSYEDGVFRLQACNIFRETHEEFNADVVILSTGFKNRLPACIEPLLPLIDCDPQGRPCLDENFRMRWNGPEQNHIYAVNFSRHGHGIAEPQTSLMAWRSATILNDLLGRQAFALEEPGLSFIRL